MDLHRIGGGQACELGPDVVDDIQITIRPIVVPQADVRADRVGVGRVQLDESAGGQFPRERIIRLQAALLSPRPIWNTTDSNTQPRFRSPLLRLDNSKATLFQSYDKAP